MADIDYTRLAEGDALAGAVLQSKLIDIRNGINALESYAIRPGAFNDNHVASMTSGRFAVVSPGYSVSIHDNGSTSAYTNTYVGFTSVTHQGYGAGGGAGWRTPGDGASNLKIAFTPTRLGTSQSAALAGIYIRANIHLHTFSGTSTSKNNSLVVAALIWYDSTGAARKILSDSIRVVSWDEAAPNAAVKIDIPLTAWIDTSITSTNSVSYVEVVTALLDDSGVAAWSDAGYLISNSNLSILPLQAAI